MSPNPYAPSNHTDESRQRPERKVNWRVRLLIFFVVAIILVPLLDWIALQIIIFGTRRLAEEGGQSPHDTEAILGPGRVNDAGKNEG